MITAIQYFNSRTPNSSSQASLINPLRNQKLWTSQWFKSYKDMVDSSREIFPFVTLHCCLFQNKLEGTIWTEIDDLKVFQVLDLDDFQRTFSAYQKTQVTYYTLHWLQTDNIPAMHSAIMEFFFCCLHSFSLHHWHIHSSIHRFLSTVSQLLSHSYWFSIHE